MSRSSELRVSVCLCTFNGARFLEEQLASIAAQTRPPDELVVCDDGSTDGSLAILDDFARGSVLEVRLFSNTMRLGSTKNFERALELATGDVYFLADQDDVWKPHKLERMARAFDDPSVGLAFSDAEVIDENGRALGYRLWQSIRFDAHMRAALVGDDFLDVLMKRWFLTGATCAMSRTLRDAVLPFPKGWIHDGWIGWIAPHVTRVRPIDEPLVLYRKHAAQQVGANAPRRLRWLPRIARARDEAELEAGIADVASRTRDLERRLDALASPRAERTSIALRDRLDHLDRRRTARRSAASARGRLVASELVRGRYGRYSSGILSALKDLLGA